MSQLLHELRAAAAIGTGTTDDTAPLQAALDEFARPAATGVVAIPTGVYRLTRPLVYRGAYTHGLTIRGGGFAAGPSGTVLRYDGPPGEPVLALRGCTSTRVCDLAIATGGQAWCGLAVNFDHERMVGTSGVFIDRVFVEGGVGPFGAAVALGYDADGNRDEWQCDRIVIRDSLLVGHGAPGTTRFGLLSGWANCKNFAVRDCGISQHQTGIKFGGSGYCIVDGFAGGGNTVTDFETATGNLEIRAGNSEHSARLLTGTTGANPRGVSITGFSWSSGRATVPDDLVISYQGVLTLTGNHLWNESRPDAVPRIQLLETPGAMTALNSSGNFYQRARGQIPVVSWDGGPLRGSPVQSFGDFGGVDGDLARLDGGLDYADGRRWSREGFYPGGAVKWPGGGGLLGRPTGDLDWIDWVERTNRTLIRAHRNPPRS